MDRSVNSKVLKKNMFKLKLFFVLNCIVLVVHAITPFPDPENGKCGFSSVKPSKHRIIGGSTAANGELALDEFHHIRFETYFIFEK